MKEKGCKAACLALCLLLCAGIFAGCGEQRSESSPTPIPTEVLQQPTEKPAQAKYMKAGETYRILIWSNSTEDKELEQEGIYGDMLRQRYNEMKEQYGVTPLYIAAPADWLGETMNSTYAGAPITDLFHFGGPFTLPSLYTHGGERGAILEAVSDYDIDFSDPEYWNQTTQAACTFGEKQYVIAPNAIGFGAVALNMVTIFNKNLITKSGYTARQLYDWSSNGEWTFDKFREVALACTDLDSEIYGTAINENLLLVSTMVASNGSNLFVKKDGKDTFNLLDSKALAAVNFLVDMAQKDKSISLSTSEEKIAFSTGHTAMLVTYANRLADTAVYRDMADDYGVLMPPKGPDAAEYVSDMNWFDGYLVMKNIMNPAGAVEFASLFFKPVYHKNSDVQGDILTAQCESYRLDANSIETLKQIPNVSHTTPYMMFWGARIGTSDDVSAMCNGHFPDFVDGSLSPDTYYASVENTVNAAVAAAMMMQE